MHEEDKEVQGLSATARYTIVALILGFMTSVEVLVLYPPLVEAGDTVKIAMLAGLGTLKFIVVVALFMHLWGDSPMFSGIFGLGMIIAVGTTIALMALMNVYPKMENAVVAPPLHEIYEQKAKEKAGGGEHGEEHSQLPTHLQRFLLSPA